MGGIRWMASGLLAVSVVASPAAAQQAKPNISAYTRGLVGYQTPNIDRIAREGVPFTDYYGEQSCTAGRASFMLGQSVFRTGLSKVDLLDGYRSNAMGRDYKIHLDGYDVTAHLRDPQ